MLGYTKSSGQKQKAKHDDDGERIVCRRSRDELGEAEGETLENFETTKVAVVPKFIPSRSLAVDRYRPGVMFWSGGRIEMAVARPLLVESSGDT